MTDSNNAFTLDSQFATIVDSCLSGEQTINKRTNHGIYTAASPQSLLFDMSNGHMPLLTNRRYFPHIAAAEVAWQILGTQNPAFIMKYAPKLWSKFIEGGKLKTAYGYRWRHEFKRDQLMLGIRALLEDRTNRQVYITAWDASCDGLGEPNQPKNIPCPIGFHVSVVNKKLNMSVFIRSSDVFVGLPYDLLAYGMLLDAMAASVFVQPGYLHITLSHAHIYKVHAEMARTNCSKPNAYRMPMPNQNIESIESDPDSYVEHVKALTSFAWRPEYNPKPEVVL